MSNPGRPLSPHLSIYRWPITMTLSILHRVSGIALSIGLLMFAWWLVAASSGDAAYQEVVSFAGSIPGRVMLIGWSAAFFFHLANGIRHLVWDLGYGFELKTANASAWFVLLLTVVLTAGYWVAL
ncbi:succinate dehydrogenase, cytochrome b556 subunit [Woeseia oceani]|uniref:Succinate dehydrogenase cytochrome b556 subunit n=1 Tax=Woeseia oceani TaxID=1548547 RepID=A0A193LFE6_9GAMM|nr:succinate dehydrogenase, cytochrome b556 subunit [Woeseia oceani]ANO51104.1 succinate dehydrogenase, cytochrome b556 subunit [Woeseia oceani]